MCLIIRTREPSKITKAEMYSALKENPDGIGVMYYAENGDIITEKAIGYSGEKIFAFLRKHGKMAEKAKSDFAIHFRYRTSGPVDTAHAHPYTVFEGAVEMMHNGVISGYGDLHTSDTYQYAAFLSGLLKDSSDMNRFLRNENVRKLIEEDITEDNRLVFAVKGSTDKSLIIYNEDTGYLYDGKWYSNLYAWDAYRLTGGLLGIPPRKENKRLDEWLKRNNPMNSSPVDSSIYNLSEEDFKFLFDDNICPEADIVDVLDWYEASPSDAIELLEAVAKSHPNAGNRKWYAGMLEKVKDAGSFEQQLDILETVKKYVVKAYAQYVY